MKTVVVEGIIGDMKTTVGAVCVERDTVTEDGF